MLGEIYLTKEESDMNFLLLSLAIVVGYEIAAELDKD